MAVWQNPATGVLYDDDGGAALSLSMWPTGLTLLTSDQVSALQNPSPTTAQVHAALQVSAQSELDKSDTTIIRCYSAAVSVPSAWRTYRAALRSIVNGTDTTSISLPSVPTYPEGT